MEMQVDEVPEDPIRECLRHFSSINSAQMISGIKSEIVVTGVGPLFLPLSASEADRLTEIGSLAPVDSYINEIEPVRLCRTWHFDLSQFSLNDYHWQKELSELVNGRLAHELGLKTGKKIELKLCKLLLHEGGGQPFAPFSDANSPVSVRNANNNDEEDFVFATLSVLLPYCGSGRDIVVAFNGQRPAFYTGHSLDFDCVSFHETFFSECHNVLAQCLASEARLALAYNLVLSSENCEPLVTENSVIISRVNQFLESWGMDNGKHKYDMLSVVFETKYKMDGLSWQCLKCRDKAASLAVITAARDTEFEVFLSKLTCYDRIGSYRCGMSDLDLCDGEKVYTFSDFVNLSTQRETCLTNRHGLQNAARRTCQIDPKCKNYLQHPANMKDRWSQQIALVLYPRKKLGHIMSKERLNLAVVFSMDWAQQLARFQSGHAQEQCCDVFTANIIPRLGRATSKLPFNFISLNSRGHFDSDASINLLDVLKKSNNRHLIELFVENVLKSRINDLSADLLKELIDCSVQFHLDLPLTFISTLIEDEKAFYTSVILLWKLCSSKTTGSSCYDNIIVHFAPKLLDQLKVPLSLSEETPKYSITPLMGRDYKVIATATSLLCIYSSLGNGDWLLRVIQYIRQTPHRHPITTVTVHVLHHWNCWLETEQAKDPDSAAAVNFAMVQKMKFIEDCIKQLKQSSKPPTEPQDYARDVSLACHCQDCNVIKYFVQHPKQNVLNVLIENTRYYERKNHIMKICENLPDLNVRLKSPKAITLCKTKASYESQRKCYQQSMLSIRNLLSLLPPEHPLHQKERNEARDEQKPNGIMPPMKKHKVDSGQHAMQCAF